MHWQNNLIELYDGICIRILLFRIVLSAVDEVRLYDTCNYLDGSIRLQMPHALASSDAKLISEAGGYFVLSSTMNFLAHEKLQSSACFGLLSQNLANMIQAMKLKIYMATLSHILLAGNDLMRDNQIVIDNYFKICR